MRISDWSSDVCSSDLRVVHRTGGRGVARARYREGEGGAAGAALGPDGIVGGDGEEAGRRRRVVVQDGSFGSIDRDIRACGGVRERDGESLVRLEAAVAGNLDGERLAQLAGGEGDRAAGQDAAQEVARKS